MVGDSLRNKPKGLACVDWDPPSNPCLILYSRHGEGAERAAARVGAGVFFY